MNAFQPCWGLGCLYLDSLARLGIPAFTCSPFANRRYLAAFFQSHRLERAKGSRNLKWLLTGSLSVTPDFESGSIVPYFLLVAEPFSLCAIFYDKSITILSHLVSDAPTKT